VPHVTVIIPTCDRPTLLRRAVASALAQHDRVNVIVVDDASSEPVVLDADPHASVQRLPVRSGGSSARNAGARASTTRYITFLDDDDELLPHAVARLRSALESSTLPAPVAVVGAIDEVDPRGNVVSHRSPPTMTRGQHYQLEPIAGGFSYHCKQSLLIERELFLAIGGFDVTFRSRVHTELFLRLNAVCSILGVPETTYRLHRHSGSRVSTNSTLRLKSFDQLEVKHAATLREHPRGHATLLRQHARVCLRDGKLMSAAAALLRSLRVQRRGSPLSPE